MRHMLATDNHPEITGWPLGHGLQRKSAKIDKGLLRHGVFGDVVTAAFDLCGFGCLRIRFSVIHGFQWFQFSNLKFQFSVFSLSNFVFKFQFVSFQFVKFRISNFKFQISNQRSEIERRTSHDKDLRDIVCSTGLSYGMLSHSGRIRTCDRTVKCSPTGIRGLFSCSVSVFSLSISEI